MNTYARINQLQIEDIFKRFGIKYIRNGDWFALYEGENLTKGRKCSISSNRGADFSGKGRAEGKPFQFVRMYLQLSNYQTYQFFKERYGIH